MILPGSELNNLILLIFGMFCLGTWATTFRLTSKWRFELYYFDFAIGTLLAALIVAFTFGSLGWDGFALADDLRIAAKQKDAIAMGAGMVFNLGNMLILGGLSIAGLAVANLIGLGMMLAAGTLIMYFASPSGNGAMLMSGVGLVAAAGVLLAVSSRLNSLQRLVALMREGKTKSTKKVVSIKGILLTAIGGLVASAFFPMVNTARQGESGLGPYSLGMFFAIGVVVCTFICNLFFMNLPVQGAPLELAAYFKGKAKFHWLGVLGGALFYVGLLSLLIMPRAEGRNILPAATIRAVMMGAAAVGTLWGLLKWKEFAGATGKIKVMLLLSLFVFAAGIVGISVSAGISTAG